MGVARITAIQIKNAGPKDLDITTGQDKASKKWAVALWIFGWGRDNPPRLLLSTEPVYENEAAAKKFMEDLVAEIKKMDVLA